MQFRRLSPPYRCAGPSRRDVLQLGSLSLLGAALPRVEEGSSVYAAARPAAAKSCIVLYLCGGPSQHDTWDPKPEAPAEVRGEFRPIATTVPGLQVGELMPRTSQLAHHCCVLRAVSTDDNSHASSVYYILTGQPHSPMNTEGIRPGPPNDHPHFGAVLQSLRKDAALSGRLPAFVTLPEQMSGNDFAVPSGQTAGFLGRAADPWLLSCDPTAPQFEVSGLTLPAEVSLDRLSRRHGLLEEVGRHLGGAGSEPAADYGRRLGQAYDMVLAASSQQSFALDREPAKVRDRYGRHKFGQCVLLARRLIESGVSLVQVNWPREPNDRQTNNPLWDTHSNHHPRMRDVLMPQMDLTYSALLEDLADRGLLDDTLVIWMGEFGRTPRFNGAGGRDHWGPVFSLALAGGGVKGGTVIGASDKLGAYPRHGRVPPPDLTATIYRALGVDTAAEVRDMLGRPHPISRGEVIQGVF
jgi:hypothetical protein